MNNWRIILSYHNNNTIHESSSFHVFPEFPCVIRAGDSVTLPVVADQLAAAWPMLAEGHRCRMSWGNLQTIIFGIVTDEWNFGVFLKMGNAMACPQFRQVWRMTWDRAQSPFKQAVFEGTQDVPCFLRICENQCSWKNLICRCWCWVWYSDTYIYIQIQISAYIPPSIIIEL